MIKQILLVGVGGAVGSIIRFLTSEITNKLYSGGFPLGTFIVNIVGCFCVGFIVNLIPTNQNLRLLLIMGFCGGFTTFSTFARETFTFIEVDQTMTAFVYTLLSCILGIAAVWLGMYLSK